MELGRRIRLWLRGRVRGASLNMCVGWLGPLLWWLIRQYESMYVDIDSRNCTFGREGCNAGSIACCLSVGVITCDARRGLESLGTTDADVMSRSRDVFRHRKLRSTTTTVCARNKIYARCRLDGRFTKLRDAEDISIVHHSSKMSKFS